LAERIPLLIIGGGIGGLATALAVSKAGYAAHVIEKSEEFAELGAGLQLAPNATRVLHTLGILDEVKKHAMFPKRLVMGDAMSGAAITTVDLGQAFLDRFDYPYLVMHRGDLLAAQLDACRNSPSIVLESNKEAVGIEDHGSHVRVALRDGSVYECDAVIGADGLHSLARKTVVDDGDPVCAQFVAYRGTVPMDEVPEDADLESMTIWVGPDLHFVQYCIRPGELFNQVAVFRSYRYTPHSDDWGTVEELEEHFGKTCPRVRHGIARIGRGRRWPMFDRPPTPNWTRGRVTLLGDAAHPMLQYIAQGACQALEDALCLGDRMARCHGDVERAFLEYQAARIPRTARVQQAARVFGDIKHVHGVGMLLRNALLASRASDDFGYIEWLYGYTDGA
jgi:2-polyprenyl-6-methoxyphenol hydroxylase-like FAD-dependent oxidoreductase